MSCKWIIGLIFLIGCTSSKNMADQKLDKDLSIELISSSKEAPYFDFNFALRNNTNKPVTILKHRGLKDRKRNEIVISSSFYELEFLPYELMCEDEPSFMDQEIIDKKVFKTASDFVTIEPKEKYLFNLKSEDYLLGVCDKNATQLKIVMKYEPKKPYFQKEYFDINYKNAKDSQQYFNELAKTHQSIIVSDTIFVKL